MNLPKLTTESCWCRAGTHARMLTPLGEVLAGLIAAVAIALAIHFGIWMCL